MRPPATTELARLSGAVRGDYCGRKMPWHYCCDKYISTNNILSNNGDNINNENSVPRRADETFLYISALNGALNNYTRTHVEPQNCCKRFSCSYAYRHG